MIPSGPEMLANGPSKSPMGKPVCQQGPNIYLLIEFSRALLLLSLLGLERSRAKLACRYSHTGLVSPVIGPLGDLIALCSGTQQQEDNQVIQCGLMGHTVLRLKLENSNQASALEGIDKYSTASQATHAPK